MASLQFFKSHSRTFKLEGTWKINNFRTVIKDNKLFEKDFNNCQRDLCTFTMGFCPKVDVEEYKGQMLLYFGVNFISSAVNSVFTDHQMSIIDKNGAKCNTKRKFHLKKYDNKNGPWGYPMFVAHSKLLNANSEWLHNDQLVIYSEGIVSLLYKNSNQLGVNLKTLLESQAHSDVTFIIGESEIQAHKAILSARSPVFEAMFEHTNTKEAKEGKVTIEDVRKEAFQEFLKYLYTGQIPGSSCVTDDLLVLADKYQVDLLKVACEGILSASLTVDTVVTLLFLADLHGASMLKKNCIDFMVQNASQVTHTTEWEKIIVQRPKLSVEITRLMTSPKGTPTVPKVDSKNVDLMIFFIEHTWSIDEFTSLLKNKSETFPTIRSATFSAPGHELIQLQLKLSIRNANYLSLWLTVKLEDSNTQGEVSIDGTFSILDMHETKCNIQQHKWSGTKSGEMEKTSLKLDNLQSDSCPFLYNGQLVILFEGTVTYQAFNYRQHLDALSNDFDNLLIKGTHSDLTFLFNDCPFNVHRAILWVRSPYFASHDSLETLNERIDGIDVEAFDTFLQFLYTGVLPVNEQLNVGLLAVSIKFQVPELQKACETQLASSLTTNSVVDILISADRHGAVQLKRKCIIFIILNAYHVTHGSEWEKLESHPKLITEVVRALTAKLAI